MRKNRPFFRLTLSIILAGMLAGMLLVPALADTPTPVAAGTATPEPTQATPAYPQISFSQLGMSEPQALQGPADAWTLRFNLPWGWEPGKDGRVVLHLMAYFSSLVSAESAEALSGLVGGNLSVSLNGTLLDMRTLQTSGEQTLTIDFDGEMLQSAHFDTANELTVSWEGQAACRMNLLSNITLLPDSSLLLMYHESQPAAILNDFPLPFFARDTFVSTPLALVLPDEPSTAEMQAALITAAGMGQLTRGRDNYQVLSLSQYRQGLTEGQNFILIAGSARLQELKLQDESGHSLPELQAGQGLAALLQAKSGYGLLLSGDETGILKSAQALAAGQIGAAGETQVIDAVNSPVTPLENEDSTLADLGAGDWLFSQQSGLEHSIDFTLPEHKQASPEATFDLVMSHSQQIDYLSSGLQVFLNGSPIASLRLNDNTSNQILFKLILPASLTHPGRNTLKLTANLSMRDICSAPTEAVAWISVSADSLLHLPLTDAVPTGVTTTFADFPESFLKGLGMQDVRFVLPVGDLSALQAGIALAYQMGQASAQPQLIQLQLADASAQPPSGTGLIFIGSPDQLAYLSKEGYFLALAFTSNGALQADSGVTVVNGSDSLMRSALVAIRQEQGHPLLAILSQRADLLPLAAASLSGSRIKNENLAWVDSDGSSRGSLEAVIASAAGTNGNELSNQPATSTDEPLQFRLGMIRWVVPLIAILLLALASFLLWEFRSRRRR